MTFLFLPFLACARAPRSAAASDPALAAAGAGSEPSTVAFATDPDPEAGRCAGYAFDGVAVGMRRSEAEAIVSLSPVDPSSSFLPRLEERTFAFHAKRAGRIDEVQVGFGEEADDPRVQHLRARVWVLKGDPWPSTLFEALGSPQRARVGEWIWWDRSCHATLRLTRIMPLGGGRSQPYILEVRSTADAGEGAADSSDSSESQQPQL